MIGPGGYYRIINIRGSATGLFAIFVPLFFKINEDLSHESIACK